MSDDKSKIASRIFGRHLKLEDEDSEAKKQDKSSEADNEDISIKIEVDGEQFEQKSKIEVLDANVAFEENMADEDSTENTEDNQEPLTDIDTNSKDDSEIESEPYNDMTKEEQNIGGDEVSDDVIKSKKIDESFEINIDEEIVLDEVLADSENKNHKVTSEEISFDDEIFGKDSSIDFDMDISDIDNTPNINDLDALLTESDVQKESLERNDNILAKQLENEGIDFNLGIESEGEENNTEGTEEISLNFEITTNKPEEVEDLILNFEVPNEDEIKTDDILKTEKTPNEDEFKVDSIDQTIEASEQDEFKINNIEQELETANDEQIKNDEIEDIEKDLRDEKEDDIAHEDIHVPNESAHSEDEFDFLVRNSSPQIEVSSEEEQAEDKFDEIYSQERIDICFYLSDISREEMIDFFDGDTDLKDKDVVYEQLREVEAQYIFEKYVKNHDIGLIERQKETIDGYILRNVIDVKNNLEVDVLKDVNIVENTKLSTGDSCFIINHALELIVDEFLDEIRVAKLNCDNVYLVTFKGSVVDESSIALATKFGIKIIVMDYGISTINKNLEEIKNKLM